VDLPVVHTNRALALTRTFAFLTLNVVFEMEHFPGLIHRRFWGLHPLSSADLPTVWALVDRPSESSHVILPLHVRIYPVEATAE
jgi:hypothetical protein